MKKNKIYLVLSLVTIITVAGMSLGSLGSAQSVPILTCSARTASVIANQAEILTASGGNGVYLWSGSNLNITNSAGTQFAVSYPNVGTYIVNVSSAGQTASCNVNVVAAPSSGNLVCSPAVQNVTLGQNANYSVTGGNGTYTWTAPDLAISNPNGSGFTANYASAGLKTLTVTSGNLSTICATNVLMNSYTPSFPNTGGGYDQ